jgi:hypothetical protein
MYELSTIVAMSTPSVVLRLAAALFLILVAVGMVYALIRLGRTLGKAEIMLNDVNTEVVPLLKQATETLDNINAELVKVDAVMTTVVDVTDKVDTTTRAVESAISVPAKKAAAWGAGVSQAVSSLFGRGAADEGAPAWDSDAAAWRRETSEPAAAEPVSSEPAVSGFSAEPAGGEAAAGPEAVAPSASVAGDGPVPAPDSDAPGGPLS